MAIGVPKERFQYTAEDRVGLTSQKWTAQTRKGDSRIGGRAVQGCEFSHREKLIREKRGHKTQRLELEGRKRDNGD